jgi:hypothetical protein
LLAHCKGHETEEENNAQDNKPHIRVIITTSTPVREYQK